MLKEYRLFGAPGTGKTTYIAKYVEQLVPQCGGDNILISSFTRAAARELSSRAMEIPDDNIGTLHSLCYQALGRPELVADHIKDFNNSEWSLNGKLSDSGGGDMHDMATTAVTDNSGNGYLAYYDLCRNRCSEDWKHDLSCAEWVYNYERWKRLNGFCDFTDLILRAITEARRAPHRPKVGIFDEVQDFTPIQLELIRQWGESMDYVMLAGDDDQCIYAFTGASPAAFLSPEIPNEQKIMLHKSYRVPLQVYYSALEFLSKTVRSDRRQAKDYMPRDAEGYIEKMSGGGLSLIDSGCRELVGRIQAEIDAGRTVMVLGYCSYMLNDLIAELRRQAIPFHNPYQTRQGNWNPLGAALSTKRASPAGRVLAYCKGNAPLRDNEDAQEWTRHDVRLFADTLDTKRHSGLIKRGFRKMIDSWNGDFTHVKYDLLYSIFGEAADDIYGDADMSWWTSHMTEQQLNVTEFPRAVYSRYGVAGLTQKPRVIVGTIHSVKGAEADTVFLSPDLSRAGYEEWEQTGTEQQEAVSRVFYVGMTRAKENLYILPQSPSSWAANITEYF